METETGNPTIRLFHALLVTMLAIILGLFCVRLRFVEDGDLKGMGFFIGSICFPLLIFNTVATARISSIDLGVILACSLGKVCVLILMYVLSFLAYEPQRSKGQRVLTAATFAFFAVASDDFAIGFPVIEALYDQDMGIYITGNALVGSFLFVPLTMIAFTIGGAFKNSESLKWCTICGNIFYDLATNPVLVMTCVGLLLKIILSGTELRDAEHLPHPLSNFINLFTAPFGMSALFLTGTSLRSPRITIWAISLVLMKVVVCAYLSYAFGTLFLGTSEDSKTYRDFTFFYGAIPTGSPPIVFAAQFDPDSTELVATAVLFGLILAGPIMFVTAYLLQESNAGNASMATFILQEVQASADASSILAGAAFLCCLLLLRRNWCFQCPVKLLLAAYGLVLLVYAVVSLMLNPLISPYSCELYSKLALRSPIILTFSWLQNTISIMLLLLQSMLVCGPRVSKEQPFLGLAMVFACFIFGLLPSLLATPHTINEICGVLFEGVSLSLTFAWCCLQLLVASALGIHGLLKARRHVELSSESDSTDSTGMESEGSCGSGSSRTWHSLVPQGTLLAISVLNVLKTLMQVVNAGQVRFFVNKNRGSFAAMLLLESVLEHAQLWVLVIALFFDGNFTSLLQKVLAAAWPRCCKPKTGRNFLWSAIRPVEPKSPVENDHGSSYCS